MQLPGQRPGQRGACGRRRDPDLTIAFIPVPDFTLLPFAGFIDAVRHSADERDLSRRIHCSWTCLSATGEPIRSSCGLEVIHWGPVSGPAAHDYLVIVGGLLQSMHRMPPGTLEFIREAAASTRIVGLPHRDFVMAEAGLMQGRHCAIHAHRVQEFLGRHPGAIPVINGIFVTDGPFITCPGGTAAIDLAVNILCEHCGRSRGMKSLTALVVDEHRSARHIARLPHRDFEDCGNRIVEQAVLLMRQNLGTPMRIAEPANGTGTTVLQLERVFKRHTRTTPLEFWRDMRLEHARWRLLNTTRTVTEIAFECGFADSSDFSRWFRTKFGEPPQRHRRLRASEVRQGRSRGDHPGGPPGGDG